MDHQAAIFSFDRRAPGQATDVPFIRLKEVLAICGKSRSSVYEAIKKGEFPKPVKLQGRSSAWIKSEVEQCVRLCISTSRTAERI
jgi:prophage regulatory protein